MVSKEYCNSVLVLMGLVLRVKSIKEVGGNYIFTFTLDKRVIFYLKINCKDKEYGFYEDRACKKKPLVHYSGTLPYKPEIRGYFEFIIEKMVKCRGFNVTVNVIKNKTKYKKIIKEN